MVGLDLWRRKAATRLKNTTPTTPEDHLSARVDSSFFLPFFQSHIFHFFSGEAIVSKLWMERQTANRREQFFVGKKTAVGGP